MRVIFTFLLGFVFQFGFCQTSNILKVTKGSVEFISTAPDETIEASTEKVVGLLNPEKMSFAFSIPISSFMGFNSELQREHFNENYMESNKYPKAVFKGRLNSEIDFFSSSSYKLIADGSFSIHGVEIKKKIEVEIAIKDSQVVASADFNILLSDHNIDIPTVVKTKLSNEIQVKVNTVFEPK